MSSAAPHMAGGARGGPPSPWATATLLLVVLTAVGSASWVINRDPSSGPPSERRLVDAGLQHANLFGDDLSEAVLSGADLSDARFDFADLAGSDLSGSTAQRTSFIGACLRGSRWDGATLTDVVLDGADVRGADFTRAVLEVRSGRDVIADDDTRWPNPSGPPPGVDVREAPEQTPCD